MFDPTILNSPLGDFLLLLYAVLASIIVYNIFIIIHYEEMTGYSTVPLEIAFLPENPQTSRFLEDIERFKRPILRIVGAVIIFVGILIIINNSTG